MRGMLSKEGYITFKCFEVSELPNLRKDFLSSCRSFPEYTAATDELVLGGFGALGNPSSFHNYFTRYVRFKVYKIVKKLLLPDYGEKFIQVLFDRILLRPAGKSPSRESWHRDITPGLKNTSLVLGGWVNLDDKSNYFSCVPGSHGVQKNSGFVKLKDQNFTGTKVEIKPGHGILFNQTIIHEVLPTKLNYDSYRVFHGFHISEEMENIFDYGKYIEDQGVPPLPSGQIPPMYAKLHWVNFLEKIETFSEKFKPDCLEIKHRTSSNTDHRIISREMKSLKEYNFPMYDPYDEKEKNIFLSHPF
jgi:hypothetical protein